MKLKKVAIYYPPTLKNGEYPLLPQNRQFKFTKSKEIRIYPVVMSTLATMLKNKGYEVLFLDGIDFRYSLEECDKILSEFKPDVIVIETKAPLYEQHLELIKSLKEKLKSLIILCGDHVSFFPEEAAKNKDVDYAVVSGYYDFIITGLLESLNAGSKVMPGGVFYKENGNVKGNREIKEYNLDETPVIDRELTKWDKFGEAYLYKPAAYILTGRGCGGANKNCDTYASDSPGRCSFCIWQHALWCRTARLKSPKLVADEIELLVDKYKVKEIFDDNESGGTWNEKWLNDFYDELLKRKLIGRFFLSSNARADSLSGERCKLLKKIGYRLLKIGLESANENTLKLIQKDEDFSQIKTGIMNAKKYGMVVLMTTMVGYPWETEEEAEKTYNETKKLMLYKTHFGDSLQSSIIMPYPGTPLYNYAHKNGLLTEEAGDLTKYDMTKHILKTNIDTAKWCKKMWKIHLHPVFLLKSLFSLRRLQDVKVAFTGLISLVGHLRDYGE